MQTLKALLHSNKDVLDIRHGNNLLLIHEDGIVEFYNGKKHEKLNVYDAAETLIEDFRLNKDLYGDTNPLIKEMQKQDTNLENLVSKMYHIIDIKQFDFFNPIAEIEDNRIYIARRRTKEFVKRLPKKGIVIGDVDNDETKELDISIGGEIENTPLVTDNDYRVNEDLFVKDHWGFVRLVVKWDGSADLAFLGLKTKAQPHSFKEKAVNDITGTAMDIWGRKFLPTYGHKNFETPMEFITLPKEEMAPFIKSVKNAKLYSRFDANFVEFIRNKILTDSKHIAALRDQLWATFSEDVKKRAKNLNPITSIQRYSGLNDADLTEYSFRTIFQNILPDKTRIKSIKLP